MSRPRAKQLFPFIANIEVLRIKGGKIQISKAIVKTLNEDGKYLDAICWVADLIIKSNPKGRYRCQTHPMDGTSVCVAQQASFL